MSRTDRPAQAATIGRRTPTAPGATTADQPSTVDGDGWLTLTRPTGTPPATAVGAGRVWLQLLALTVLVLAVVITVAVWTSDREAVQEGEGMAARRTALLATAVIEPALRDGLTTGDPAAFRALDRAVRERVLDRDLVRVKVWDRSGRILYSDEPRLVGEHYDLEDEELEILGTQDATGAEVSELDAPENRYERDQGKLLEVYYPVHLPNGTPLLFETYTSYDSVRARGNEICQKFVFITVFSVLAFLLLMVPVVWRLLARLRQGQEQRQHLLEGALSASQAERHRIAATLHDGPVQELAAASFLISGAGQRAADAGNAELADSLSGAAGGVRSSIQSLRSLLIDIYPPSLSETGLEQALADLVLSRQSQEVDVALRVEAGVADGLPREQAQLFFQVAQEALRNAVRHASARSIEVHLTRSGDRLVLVVADDGAGFDVSGTLDSPAQGHFGLRLLRDAAVRAGAGLRVRSSDSGTTWELEALV